MHARNIDNENLILYCTKDEWKCVREMIQAAIKLYDYDGDYETFGISKQELKNNLSFWESSSSETIYMKSKYLFQLIFPFIVGNTYLRLESFTDIQREEIENQMEKIADYIRNSI